MSTYDLVIKNCSVVRPGQDAVERLDVAVKDGKFAAIEPVIDANLAERTVDGTGRLLFPGVVDAHQHWGIYSPLSEDADSESRASAAARQTRASSSCFPKATATTSRTSNS
jgi:allantoinase